MRDFGRKITRGGNARPKILQFLVLMLPITLPNYCTGLSEPKYMGPSFRPSKTRLRHFFVSFFFFN